VSNIEWTDVVWNPTTGCDRVSPGCDNCYALTMAKRLKGMGSAKYQIDGDPRTSGPGFGLTMHPSVVTVPLSWRAPQRVFVNSMSDLFHAEVSADFTARVFAVMALAGRHTFQVLTKRAKRMELVLTRPGFVDQVARHVEDILGHSGRRPRWAFDLGGRRLAGDSGQLGQGWSRSPERAWVPPWPMPNVWLGVSVENQREADRRIPHLERTPAAVRWLSCEPLLSPVDLKPWLGTRPIAGKCFDIDGQSWHDGCQDCRPALHWVVVGGESGSSRPMDPDWARALRDQCAAAEVPFFFKQAGQVLARQWGCRDPKGHDPADWPEPFPRAYPDAA